MKMDSSRKELIYEGLMYVNLMKHKINSEVDMHAMVLAWAC